MDDFPPNSDRSKLGETEEKKVERVTTTDPVRKKKGLGRKFKDTFFGGDARTAFQYVVFSVLIPAAKDAIYEAGQEGIRALIFGESRRPRSGPVSGASGYVNYNRYSSSRTEPPRQISHQGRARHDFDELVLDNRQEAEDVIERLHDLVDRFGEATIADFYALMGVHSSHVDHKWGWTNIRGTGTVRVGNGYVVNLPPPTPLSN